jgi:predicted nucleic acid-binding protein
MRAIDTGVLARLSVRDHAKQAAVDRFQESPKLGFLDCLIVQSAVKAGHTPLGTFDRALGKTEAAELL